MTFNEDGRGLQQIGGARSRLDTCGFGHRFHRLGSDCSEPSLRDPQCDCGSLIVKSEEEIGFLRKAGKIARKVIDAMVETARPGIPDAAVYAEMIKTQIANGGGPNIFNLFAACPLDHATTDLWHLLHVASSR